MTAPPKLPHRATTLAMLLGAAVLGQGCASVDPDSFAKGASMASVVQAMGRSTAEYATPDGGKALEYAAGPYGKSTLLFRFDATGQLLDARQALTELQFNRILPGMAASEGCCNWAGRRPSGRWRFRSRWSGRTAMKRRFASGSWSAWVPTARWWTAPTGLTRSATSIRRCDGWSVCRQGGRRA